MLAQHVCVRQSDTALHILMFNNMCSQRFAKVNKHNLGVSVKLGSHLQEGNSHWGTLRITGPLCGEPRGGLGASVKEGGVCRRGKSHWGTLHITGPMCGESTWEVDSPHKGPVKWNLMSHVGNP